MDSLLRADPSQPEDVVSTFSAIHFTKPVRINAVGNDANVDTFGYSTALRFGNTAETNIWRVIRALGIPLERQMHARDLLRVIRRHVSVEVEPVIMNYIGSVSSYGLRYRGLIIGL